MAGCEACHGPGKEHVEGGGDKSKIFTFKGVSAQAASERCLDCHTYGEEHSNFARSAHLQNDVGCVDCHSPHHARESQFLMKEKQPLLCYGCHQEAKQQFNRPFHHRVNEGLVQCSDCHNPHAGFQARQLRATASQDLVCFKCHSEKAGPFVHEHPPVKTEGCVFCHTPHGSANPRLLKRSQVNLLCLECHAFTIDPGAPATPIFPQPGTEVSGVHHVPCGDSRVKLRRFLLQIGESMGKQASQQVTFLPALAQSNTTVLFP